MSEDYNVGIVSRRHGRGYVSFFDEPFGEQTPFQWAGGYSVYYDNGFCEGGPMSPGDQAIGLDAWLERMGWKRLEEIEASVEV